MAWLAVVLAFAFGLALGAALWRKPEPDPWSQQPELVVEDSEAIEQAKSNWTPRMSPERYLRVQPNGPHAELARQIVGDGQ